MTDGTHQPGGPPARDPGPANAGAPRGGPPPGPYGAFGPAQGPYGPQVPYGPPGFPLRRPGPAEPDWEALAEAAACSARRRRRMRTIGTVVAACLLGAGVGGAVLEGRGGHPQASGAPAAPPAVRDAPSGAPSDAAPTVPGRPDLLADRSGRADLALGPGAQVDRVQNGHVLRLRADPDSYAQSTDRVVDVSRSFSVSAWVYDEAGGGSRAAVSQGDGGSYSFLLGRDETDGHRAWTFRVRTADGGADGTAVQVLSGNADTVDGWAQLTAVYDADRRTVALYVNGGPAGSAEVPGIRAGSGPLQIGRAGLHGGWGDCWAGAIGYVRVWDRAIPAEQIGGDGSAVTAEPVASWLVG
ncbi:hypothetical protein Kpho02_36170 [Kitasatospora phosalacinea]|uniref:LamG-like jellyroll fold domain-containing protein n=1 Tax=Kitasatospora phosalacinea TaxID=2065 RepID=A0A9W6QAE2_9ACTN|nr:LamG domain-containing protein [Kitasatospora phosalacinea]GLW71318.1 hypothetical protein Kpho02_36170 [Kitasatospora phosalacinea]